MSTTQNARKKLTMAVAQENLYSHNIVRAVAKVDSSTMGTIYNPYTSLPAITDAVVSSADYNVRAYAADADTLQVNRRVSLAEHVNSYDEKSMPFSVVNDRAMNFGMALANDIDRAVFAGVSTNGGFNMGDGGTLDSTTPWEVTNTSIDDIISASIERIDINEGHGQKKFMVVSPREMSKLRGFLMGTGNNVADEVIKKGVNYRGTTVNGIDIYQTNNLTNSVTLTFTGVATNAQTITIAGIVLTTVSSIGTTAGNVLIGANQAATCVNAAALLNAPRTTTSTGVALSEENAALIERLGLTAQASGDTLIVTAQATIEVSETQTNASWGNTSRRVIVGAYDSIFLALPTAGMDYEEKKVGGKAGVELYMEQFYNHTVWTRKKPLVGTVLVR